jgi:peptidyl-prolyl cis-trans isomerase SurA
LLRNKATFALVFCGGLVALATGSIAAQETGSSAAPRAARPAGTTTASLAKPVNELPDASAENSKRDIVGVVAIVNDDIISDYDLRQRIGLVAATSGVRPQNEEQKKALRAQILRQLETEKMQVQEANRKNIQIGSDDVDKAIDNILKENGLDLGKLKEVLGRNGVNVSTLRSQIAVQLAWQKAVEDEFASEVQVKPADVDTEFARVQAGAKNAHYMVAEIFLGVDNPEQDEKIHKDIQQIYDQIKQGAPFNVIARQFSQSPSAASGGDLGTIEQGQLAPELDAGLTKLHVGDISEPIRSVGGYYILFLRRRWEPVGTVVNTQDENRPATNATPLIGVLLPIGPKPPPELQQRALQVAQQIRSNVRSCQNLDQIVAAMHGAVYQDFAKQGLRLSDLSEQIQAEVAKTPPGEVSAPFVIPAMGIEVVARCDKAVEKKEVWELPTKDQVEQQLFADRISSLARGYLARLKRNADVQDR